jgi:hypothetical protein
LYRSLDEAFRRDSHRSEEEKPCPFHGEGMISGSFDLRQINGTIRAQAQL